VNDFSYSDALYINPTGGGTFGSSTITNSWFKSTYGNDVTLDGGIGDGVIDGNLFSGLVLPKAGVHGIAILGSRVRNMKFVDCYVVGAGFQGSPIAASIFVNTNAGSDSPTTEPVEFLDTRLVGQGGTPVYGVYLAAGAGGLLFRNVTTYDGHAVPWQVNDGLTMMGPNGIQVRNCVGFGGNPSATYGPIIVGASYYGTIVLPVFTGTNVAIKNPFPSDMIYYISGGSGVTNISVGTSVSTSVRPTGLTSGMFSVPYGTYISATYSGTAPVIAAYMP
jgi:hypothetical protein